jgi:predicted nucleic acid-binding protein
MQRDTRLVVVDASVVLKWQLDDEDCITQATALRDDFFIREVIKAVAPQLLVYEVINGITVAMRRERISSQEAHQAIEDLLGLGVELREIKPVRVLELSIKHHLAAYDAAYLALAENENCILWTGDRAFYQSLKNELTGVKWIGDYPLES